MFDELLGKTQRAYRIYWKNKEGKMLGFTENYVEVI